MHAVNDEVRKEVFSGVHMTGALLRLVKDSARRYTENKRKALTATRHLPSAVLSRMDDVLAKAHTITSGVSFPEGGNKRTARVESTARPGVGYTSKMVSIASYDCGVPALTGLPCHHNVAHARFTGLHWQNFVDPLKTVAVWKAQYPLDLHFPDVPNLAEAHAHELYDPVLKLLPAAPKRKGRSKQQKRKAGVLERFGGNKRSFTCSKYKRMGHRASKCPRIV
ncbi:hypothetical protein CYMTET_13730 [Cymbomonas tetramitiformis]|uniref:SWIM-type domain-containing protein n=1 Tax=Cymbomonas tetramitiformis TaxID=36881 RepID=A0AAE0GHH6_9CHLO|nr:hypothetical protein CYMTET_13730 [Cymbomonas tetramitiformis]